MATFNVYDNVVYDSKNKSYKFSGVIVGITRGGYLIQPEKIKSFGPTCFIYNKNGRMFKSNLIDFDRNSFTDDPFSRSITTCNNLLVHVSRRSRLLVSGIKPYDPNQQPIDDEDI